MVVASVSAMVPSTAITNKTVASPAPRFFPMKGSIAKASLVSHDRAPPLFLERPVMKEALENWVKRSRVSGLDMVVFFRSLATLQHSAVPLLASFDALGQSVESPTLQSFCENTSNQLAQGHPLSNCLRRFPEVFTPFHVHLAGVGEQTGNLSEVLGYIATFEESRERLGQKIRSALIYPTMVGVVALVGLVFVLPYVLDGIFEVIRDSGAEPPMITKLVMGVSAIVSSPVGWALLLVFAGFLLGPVRTQLKTARVRPYLLAIPGLGNCLRTASSARFASALCLCLRSGLNIQRSIALAARATGDPLLIEQLPRMKKSVEEGSTIAEALASVGFFTPLFLELVSSGEEVGKTDEMLGWIATNLEKDLEQDLQTYAGLLEPLMLLFVGIIVGVIVIATALPMLNLVQNLG